MDNLLIILVYMAIDHVHTNNKFVPSGVRAVFEVGISCWQYWTIPQDQNLPLPTAGGEKWFASRK